MDGGRSGNRVGYGGPQLDAEWQFVGPFLDSWLFGSLSLRKHAWYGLTPLYKTHLVEDNLLSLSLDNTHFLPLGHGQSRTRTGTSCRLPSFSSLILLRLRRSVVAALLCAVRRSFALCIWSFLAVFTVGRPLSVVRLGSPNRRTRLLLVPVRPRSLGSVFGGVLWISQTFLRRSLYTPERSVFARHSSGSCDSSMTSLRPAAS